jgi:hypothetical protein
MEVLTKSRKIRPLTWSRHFDNDIPPHHLCTIVVCSKGHPSSVQHIIDDRGNALAPGGQSPSMHCGRCGENLPLLLADWTPTKPANCSRCTRGMDASDADPCCT